MRRSFLQALCVAAATSLAACGGGGAHAAGPASAIPAAPGPASAQKTPMTIKFRLNENGPASRTRAPKYVPPSSNGVAISVNGGPPSLFDISASSSICSPNPDGSRTCTLQLLAPVGQDTFTITLYDQPPANGSPQGDVVSTQTLSFTVQAGQNNTLPITLNGVPATVILSPSGFAVPPNQTSTLTLYVSARDASGFVIVGPGNYSTPINLTISGDPNSTTTLSQSSIQAPSTSSVTVTYNGGPITAVTITASAAGATSATATLTQATAGANASVTVPPFAPRPFLAAYASQGTLRHFPANANGTISADAVLSGGDFPMETSYDSAGNLYVLRGSQRVDVYDAGGSFVRSVGGAQTFKPYADFNGFPLEFLAVDGAGDIFVAYGATQIGVWQAGSSGDVPYSYVIGDTAGTVLSQVIQMRAGADGTLYVADNAAGGPTGSIKIFPPQATTPAAVIASNFGSFGIVDLGVAGDGTLYALADDANAGESIAVFAPPYSSSTTQPTRTLTLQPASCTKTTIDADANNRLYADVVCGSVNNEVAIYDGTASGAVSPMATIPLPTGYPWSIAARGNSFSYTDMNTFATTRATYDGTTVATMYTVSGGNPGMIAPVALAKDSSGTIYALSTLNNAVVEYAQPIASGNPQPVRMVTPFGRGRSFGVLSALAVDANNNLFVANGNAINVYAPGVSGNVAPMYQIAGGSTGLKLPRGMHFGPNGSLWVANFNNSTVTQFAPGASGNVAPIATLSGASTKIANPYDVWVRGDGSIYVLVRGKVLSFAPGSSGNVAPSSVLSVPAAARHMAFDQNSNLFVSAYSQVNVYASNASGNAQPVATITDASGVNDFEAILPL